MGLTGGAQGRVRSTAAATGTMNSKQKIALRIIADWADRFACVKSAVIYGSVARCDEKPSSDLDLDLEFDTGPGMAVSYTHAQQSFDKLSRANLICDRSSSQT